MTLLVVVVEVRAPRLASIPTNVSVPSPPSKTSASAKFASNVSVSLPAPKLMVSVIAEPPSAVIASAPEPVVIVALVAASL